jgi:antitoxin component of RelBE/YafQ-DinJ toxin-antitoxin module
MTVLFRCRVPAPLLKKANALTKDLGTSTPEIFRIFLHEVVRTGKVPVSLSTSPPHDDLVDKKRRNRIWSELDESEGW